LSPCDGALKPDCRNSRRELGLSLRLSRGLFAGKKQKENHGAEVWSARGLCYRLIDDCQLRQRTFTLGRRPKKEAAPKVKPAKKLAPELHVNSPQINCLLSSSKITRK
jgi:hypothetical protein